MEPTHPATPEAHEPKQPVPPQPSDTGHLPGYDELESAYATLRKRSCKPHRASRRLPALMLMGCCALTLVGLPGCAAFDRAGSALGDLASTSVQDALDDASSTLDEAANDLSDLESAAAETATETLQDLTS